ncbi:hypothetical protein DLR63_17860 [Vibrio tarriae]|nr:hypothetical protein DLR63_17860 [Vibrio tarriae]
MSHQSKSCGKNELITLNACNIPQANIGLGIWVGSGVIMKLSLKFIKKRRPFLWGAAIFLALITLSLLGLRDNGSYYQSRHWIDSNSPWYIQFSIAMLGVALMTYSQAPRSKLGQLGKQIYRFILWVVRQKQARKPRV